MFSLFQIGYIFKICLHVLRSVLFLYVISNKKILLHVLDLSCVLLYVIPYASHNTFVCSQTYLVFQYTHKF